MFRLTVIIISVPVLLSSPGLRSSGPLGHDDLVDPENGDGGVSGQFQGPVLDQVGVQDALLQRVNDFTTLDVDTVGYTAVVLKIKIFEKF